MRLPTAIQTGLRALLLALMAVAGWAKAGDLSLGNLVFRDENGNQQFEAGTDTGVDGVLVQLFPITANPYEDAPLAQMPTTAGGLYLFQNLDAGDYVIFIPPGEFQPGGALAGLMSLPGLQDEGDDDVGEDGLDDSNPELFGIITRTITLQTDGAPTVLTGETGFGSTMDDADDAKGDLTVDLGFYHPMQLGNLVFADMNNNGHADPGEGIPGVTVQLFYSVDDPAGTPPLADVTTDAEGRFLFGGLASGYYRLHLPPSEFGPDGNLQGATSMIGTADEGTDDDVGEDGVDELDPVNHGLLSMVVELTPDGEPTGISGETGFGSAEDDADDANSDLTVDLGLSFPAGKVGVGNLVFVDANLNNLADADEGVDGVKVQLFAAGADPTSNLPLAERTTNRGGFYLFGNLDPGDYFLHVPASEFAFGKPLFAVTSIAASNAVGDDHQGEDGLDAALPGNTGVSTAVFTLTANAAPTNEAGLGGSNDDFRDSEVDLTHDLGFRLLSDEPLGVGNLIFIDADHDGFYSENEGRDEVRVQLFREGEDPQTALALDEVITENEGLYRFSGLAPGRYFVHVPASEFAVNEPLHLLLSLPGAGADNGQDDGVDENGVDAVNPGLTGISSVVFELSDDDEPTSETSETGRANGDDFDADDNTDLTIDLGFVATCPTMALTPPILNQGIATLPYSQSLSATGGSAPYQWNVIGDLPPGLSLDPDTGVITGAPTQAGEYSFTIEAQDATGCRVTAPRSLSVLPEPTTVGVGNVVFVDQNHDGIFQAQEGVNDVTMELYLAGHVPGTDLPQASIESFFVGCYFFRDLAPGNYFVHIPASEFGPTGQLYQRISAPGVSVDNGADDASVGHDNGIDAADPATTGISSLSFELNTGTEPVDSPGSETGFDAEADNSTSGDSNFDSTIDLMFVASPAVTTGLGNLVFVDSNRNGRFDVSEGLDGVLVQVFGEGADPLTAPPVASQTTSNGGLYRFDGLTPGSYFVHVPASQFAVGMPLASMISVTGQGGDDGVDDDEPGENGVDAAQPQITGISSNVVVLALGTEPEETGVGADDDVAADSNNDLTVDLGFVVSCPTLVIQPTNLPPATAGQAYSQVLSASIGTGPLTWIVSDGSLPEGLTFDAETATISGVATTEGSSFFSIRVMDALACQGEQTFNFTVLEAPRYLSVGNLIYADSNASGRYEPGEGLPGVEIHLYAELAVIGIDAPLAITTSGTGGFYSFNELSVGDYFLHIPATQFGTGAALENHRSLAGHGVDDGLDDGVDENGIDSASPTITGISSVVFHLAADTEPTDAQGETGANAMSDNAVDGDSDLTIDFGFIPTSHAQMCVGNLVFTDANRSGGFDAGEGRSGVVVQLFKAGTDPQNDSAFQTEITSSDGRYLFIGLVPGRYFVHIRAETFQPGDRLTGQSSIAGAGADDASDDDVDENGVDAVSPSATGVSSMVFNLGFQQEPTDAQGETGFFGSSDNGDDANINLTIDLGFQHPALSITPLTLADGEVMQEYAQQLSATGGTGPYTFSVDTGSLPLGLTLSSTGQITGTPTADGEFEVSVQALDANGASATQAYTLFIAQEQFAAVGNLIFFDVNANGRADLGEGINGVTVELYDEAGTPGSSAPLHSQITSNGGQYLFSNLSVGSYRLHVPASMFAEGAPLFAMNSISGVGTGDDDASEDGEDAVSPLTTGVSTALFSLSIGNAPTESTGENGLHANSDDAMDANTDLTRDFGFVDATPRPANYSDWSVGYNLESNGAPTANPDGDLRNNLLEYALGDDPTSGVQETLRLRLEENIGGGFDIVLTRRRGGQSDLIYTIEISAVLGSSNTFWGSSGIQPVITVNTDGTETLRYSNLQSDPSFGGAPNGFVRLHVALDENHDETPEAEATSAIMGWGKRTLATRNQTYAVPFMNAEVVSGNVDAVFGNLVDLTTAAGTRSISTQFQAGRQYYLESTDGDHVGHRWEIDEATSSATSVTLIPSANHSTLDQVPETLSGDAVAVRAHWQVQDLFPVTDFQATTNPATADQLLFFNPSTSGFTTLWLLNMGGNPRWVELNDATFADAGLRVIAPCDGLFTKPRTTSVSSSTTGLVRTWPLACPLRAGSNFIGNPWPVNESPLSRRMTVPEGFTGTSNFLTADRIYLWNGDTGIANSYTNYYLLKGGELERWVRQSDATFGDQTDTPLFQATSAAFIIRISAKPDWMLTPPFVP